MNAYKNLLDELDCRLRLVLYMREGLDKEDKKKNPHIDGVVTQLEREIKFLQPLLDKYTNVDVDMDIQLKPKPKHNARNAGRPKSYTDEQVAAAKEWRKTGKSYAEIARLVGVSTGTAYKILNDDPIK